MRPICTLVLVVFLCAYCSGLHANEQRAFTQKKKVERAGRVALVIGNGAYKSGGTLKNPVNDAWAITHTLQELDFQVQTISDASKKQMWKAIRKFSRALRTAELGLFFYAGHGMQVDGANYLIPVTAQVEVESDIEYESIPVGRILGRMEDAGNSLNIVVLDACRDNPFERSFRTSTKGLARMDAPEGTIIAYATSPGSVAADGKGDNGLYTAYLLQALQEPGLSLQEIFNQAGMGVIEASKRRQVPWMSSTPVPPYYLRGKRDSGDDELWKAVQGSIAPADYRYYLQEYPRGRHASVARFKLRKLAEKSTLPLFSGSSYRDSVTEMEFVYIKGGCYQMGDTFGEGDPAERPVHEVCVDDFYMGRYEVTQKEWHLLMGSNPAHFKKGSGYPVEQVSWNDTQDYIRRLNQQTRKAYRLPTEAEWEYAAREQGKKTRFGTGKNTLADDEANFDASAEYKTSYSRSGQYRQKTLVVGSFPTHSLGLYDMAGNVWEWCSDWYDTDYYSSSPRLNPQGPASGTERVIRGGSWLSDPWTVRTTLRYGVRPDDASNNLGFRLVLPVH